jgi:GalNAc-alpha-(1->4)-GalNAc-alpha-(1->3)-diNAcBac-PP-undecaprenol alpha-1,4-N-acetyl-D-galactosaminyltransferase
MKILLVIDSLNSGGAQRQIVTLALGLKKRNYDVVVLTYSLGDHFQSALEQGSVVYVNVHNHSPLKTLRNVFLEIIRQKPGIICAYLYRPSLMALVSKFFYWRPKVFVSERSFEDPMADWSRGVSRLFYPLARRIIINSRSQLELVKKKMPWLRKKMIYIGNGVDLALFHPESHFHEGNKDFVIVSVGHVNQLKNTKVLIRALATLREQHKLPVTVHWVGRNYDVYGTINPYYFECIELLRELHLDQVWHWEGKRQDIDKLYRSADLVIHPSLGEGFPNVVCEALASGCPVGASEVFDHPFIIKEGLNGFLFDPKDPVALAEKIRSYYGLSFEKKLNIRENCRSTAVNQFAVEKMIDSYERVFNA